MRLLIFMAICCGTTVLALREGERERERPIHSHIHGLPDTVKSFDTYSVHALSTPMLCVTLVVSYFVYHLQYSMLFSKLHLLIIYNKDKSVTT